MTRARWALAGITEKQWQQMFDAAGVPRAFWDMNARGGDPANSLALSDPAVCVTVVGYEYRPGAEGGEISFADFRSYLRDKSDLRLAVIPSDLPVDLKTRGALRTRALLLTPVAVLGDGLAVAVLVPVVIVASPIVVPMLLTLRSPSPPGPEPKLAGSLGPPEPEPETVSRHYIDYVQAGILPPERP